jgi:hypothetical protein
MAIPAPMKGLHLAGVRWRWSVGSQNFLYDAPSGQLGPAISREPL